jgi:tetratricopeptide (TPR) repeat protein
VDGTYLAPRLIVDAKERWQALQARLAAARAFIDANDRARALEEIDAALAVDPRFLAAQSLRERVLSQPDDHARTLVPAGYAQFEDRARRRRVERRLDAARAAIDNRRLEDAASSLDEVIELDPHEPELMHLTAAFDDMRRAAHHASRGPGYVAAAVFAGIVLGASWIGDRSHLQSRPMTATVELIATAAPQPLATASARVPIEPVGTSGRVAPPAVTPTIVAPVSAARLKTDDEVLVKQALERYRVAYNRLDARSAQAVWPAVDHPALARAFDGLESQTLTFDTCDVQMQNETAATAMCRGTSRYVPKVGSPTPRTEPCAWSFLLRKAGNDWKIESTRVER